MNYARHSLLWGVAGWGVRGGVGGMSVSTAAGLSLGP